MLVPLHHDLGKKDKSNIINNNKDIILFIFLFLSALNTKNSISAHAANGTKSIFIIFFMICRFIRLCVINAPFAYVLYAAESFSLSLKSISLSIISPQNKKEYRAVPKNTEPNTIFPQP